MRKNGLPQIDSALNELLAEWGRNRAAAVEKAVRRRLKLDDGRVHVTILMVDEPSAAAAIEGIESLGGSISARYGQLIDTWIAISKLEDLADLSGVSLIHRTIPPVLLREAQSVGTHYKAGTYVSQGVSGANADSWHQEGFTGEGVWIALIDSFQLAGSAQSAG